MDEETMRNVAAQLRKPHGEYALQIAERMNVSNHFLNQLSIENLQLKPKQTILEIGMGNGFFIKDLFAIQNDLSYYGYDYSLEMIEEANRINKQFVDESKVKFFHGNIKDLPFKNNEFDAIFTVNTLYFWDDYELALKELHRVLKSNARLIVSIRPKFSMKAYPFVKYGFNMFSKASLMELLNNNQFKVIQSIEKEEQPIEINGEMVPVHSLVVISIKL